MWYSLFRGIQDLRVLPLGRSLLLGGDNSINGSGRARSGCRRYLGHYSCWAVLALTSLAATATASPIPIAVVPASHLVAAQIIVNNVTINFVTIEVPPGGEVTPAVIETDCEVLMASFNAAAGQADPFERSTEAEFEGSDTNMACQTSAGVPGQ